MMTGNRKTGGQEDRMDGAQENRKTGVNTQTAP